MMLSLVWLPALALGLDSLALGLDSFPDDPIPDSVSSLKCGKYEGVDYDCDKFCATYTDCGSCAKSDHCVWCDGDFDTAGGYYGVINTPGCLAADRFDPPFKCLGDTCHKKSHCPGQLAWWQILLIVVGVVAFLALVAAICLFKKLKELLFSRSRDDSSSSPRN
ncbi:MAG: hypothetical protein KVP17_003724 [Porospora cf. gigantea B]|uniref:uncharacterized protein n=1 Tax=Porospora cf. gigantea B TaxID=2853592 RepID=UPI003571ADCF|nr:MAG: hypothetical protein KVP17_003724 [Porospora cf. gigantea B]